MSHSGKGTRTWMGSLVALLAVAGVSVVDAQQPDTSAPRDTTPYRLPPVVTVTRDVGRSTLELPYAISTVRPDSARPGQQHTSLDQTLFLLPGVTVANRNNPSQDPRISIRGFGARSAFGVRSIRVLRDGMPLTLPDGQTPVDFLDLEAVGRIEVIRGTASALYGNASGGVIDIRSAPPPTAPFAAQLRGWGGSYDAQRYTGVFGGTVGRGFYQGNVGYTDADNYREYSRNRLTNGFLGAGLTAGGTDYRLQVMAMDEPLADNPGALTQAQLDSAPQMADPAQVRKRARKEVSQVLVGLSGRRAFVGNGELFAQVYGGARSLYNPLTFAVVDVERGQYGAGARATLPARAFGLTHRLSIGADYGRQNDKRKNWANCNGLADPTGDCPDLRQERGAISLNQREIVSSIGPYVRDEIEFGDKYDLSIGLREDVVHFEVQDALITDGDPDDSGDRTMSAFSPMLGFVARIAPLHSVYANIASAFETPTTTELGNQADGSAGLNRDLKPQHSTTYELGLKGIALTRVQYDVSLFDTEVRDELIPFEIPGGAGRTFFRNAGRTRRQGVELEIGTQVGPLEATASYTYSHFRFRDFEVDTNQFAGNVIPGIPTHQVQAATTWRHRGVFATLEALAKSGQFVDDPNTAQTSGFFVMNVRAGGTALFGRPWFAPVIGVNNLFDKHYVNSVAVNASAGKYFEPATGRTVFAGLTLGLAH